MKINLLLLILICAIAGCKVKPTELDIKVSQLKEGMTKSEVKALFNNFVISNETNRVGKVELIGKHDEANGKLYGTNNIYSSEIFYEGKSPKIFPDYCSIYFDSNNVIVAHMIQRYD